MKLQAIRARLDSEVQAFALEAMTKPKQPLNPADYYRCVGHCQGLARALELLTELQREEDERERADSDF